MRGLDMSEKEILKKLIKIANNQQKAITKLAQMGAGATVRFHHPQYFARVASSLFENAVGNRNISIILSPDKATFFDDSGTMDYPTLQQTVTQTCIIVEKSLHLIHGELFNYDDLKPA
jgi:hypothetical protein